MPTTAHYINAVSSYRHLQDNRALVEVQHRTPVYIELKGLGLGLDFSLLSTSFFFTRTLNSHDNLQIDVKSFQREHNDAIVAHGRWS